MCERERERDGWRRMCVREREGEMGEGNLCEREGDGWRRICERETEMGGGEYV